jgi:hypothetical protein
MLTTKKWGKNYPIFQTYPITFILIFYAFISRIIYILIYSNIQFIAISSIVRINSGTFLLAICIFSSLLSLIP